jgi:protein-disulfide isomerase
VESHSKDVQLRFYNFPLDNSCNDVIGGGDGVSCLLAKSVSCAEKVSSKGWQMHDDIFSAQEEISRMGLPQAKEKVMAYATNHSVNTEEFTTCLDSDETQEWIKSQAKAGVDSGVRGTPSIYVNSRRLPRGQAIPVLQRAYLEAR